MENILIIRFSSLGDIVLLSSIFEKIKKERPHCKIVFLTHERFSSVLQGNPFIDEIISFPDTARKNRKEEKLFFLSLVQKNFTLVFDMHSSLRSQLLSKKIKAHNKKTNKAEVFALKKYYFSRYLLTHIHVYLNFRSNFSWQHQRDKYNQVLQAAGFYTPMLPTALYPTNEDEKKIKDLLPSARWLNKAIAISPGAAWPLKQWPIYYYIELTHILVENGYHVVLLGAATEHESEEIFTHVHSSSVLNLCGKLTILQTAALLKRSRLTVGNDSAIIHISEAMGTPAIAIMGPTSQELGFSPYLEKSLVAQDFSYSCRPCTKTGKGKCRFSKTSAACLHKVFPVGIYQMIKAQMETP